MRDGHNVKFEQSMRFFTLTRSGEVQSRISNDISSIQGMVTSTATALVVNLSVLVSICVALIVISAIASAVGTVLITHLANLLGMRWSLSLAGTWIVGVAILSCLTPTNEHRSHHQRSKRWAVFGSREEGKR